mmetsp:Transcript_863/g.1295  ORF Transcript_863/g.1295 Transcript_863/m.1295 type:complete len:81 (-) Transcript_863:61-303(-)
MIGDGLGSVEDGQKQNILESLIFVTLLPVAWHRSLVVIVRSNPITKNREKKQTQGRYSDPSKIIVSIVVVRVLIAFQGLK